jgi:VIT1/CCC1 family predicted Fe2+/Mn2+ transporter
VVITERVDGFTAVFVWSFAGVFAGPEVSTMVKTPIATTTITDSHINGETIRILDLRGTRNLAETFFIAIAYLSTGLPITPVVYHTNGVWIIFVSLILGICAFAAWET